MRADNNHKVYTNADGEPVMRITEIIRALAKDQIAVWANMLGFRRIDYRKELDRTARVGTMFHSIVEQYMTPGQLAVIDYAEYGLYGFKSQQEFTNAVRSFFAWYDNLSVPYVVKFTEKVVIGKRYGGTIDCGIAGFDDPDKLIFVDYKTSSSFYLAQFLQLCGYVRIYEELHGPDTIEGVMVILADKKNGEPARAKFIGRDELELLLLCFDSLYETARMTKLLNDSWKQLGSKIV